MSKIGFIGLGIMGKPMLRNLRKAGHELVAYDIHPAGLDAVVGDGVERGITCKDVASRTEIVITMLPDGPEVEQAILGPAGVCRVWFGLRWRVRRICVRLGLRVLFRSDAKLCGTALATEVDSGTLMFNTGRRN